MGGADDRLCAGPVFRGGDGAEAQGFCLWPWHPRAQLRACREGWVVFTPGAARGPCALSLTENQARLDLALRTLLPSCFPFVLQNVV